jgi:hypothetical protein
VQDTAARAGHSEATAREQNVRGSPNDPAHMRDTVARAGHSEATAPVTLTPRSMRAALSWEPREEDSRENPALTAWMASTRPARVVENSSLLLMALQMRLAGNQDSHPANRQTHGNGRAKFFYTNMAATLQEARTDAVQACHG